jgi:ribosomal-protein-alanine N-acetyltransferase
MTTHGIRDDAAVAVRRAERADLDDVVAIEREAFTLPWSRESFDDLLRARQAVFLVAVTSDGTIRGYAVLLIAADMSELANLAVASGMRGRGIGRRLLSEAIAHARERHASHITLEVRESNHRARSLYAAAGFRSVGKRRRYYDEPVEDALVCRLDLNA